MSSRAPNLKVAPPSSTCATTFLSFPGASLLSSLVTGSCRRYVATVPCQMGLCLKEALAVDTVSCSTDKNICSAWPHTLTSFWFDESFRLLACLCVTSHMVKSWWTSDFTPFWNLPLRPKKLACQSIHPRVNPSCTHMPNWAPVYRWAWEWMLKTDGFLL